jgi:DNA polymerase I-like protein with 3'-5' exonuclease and polymerase domains
MAYIFIDDKNEALGLCNKIKDYSGLVGADLETTGLDWILNKILLLQLNLGEEIYIVDIRRVGYEVFKQLILFLAGDDKVVIFHNAKFDLKFIYYATGILLTNVYDSMIVEAVLTAGKGLPFFSLEDLAAKYTDVIMDKTVRKMFINFPDEMPFTETMLQYSALDVLVLPEIYYEQVKLLEDTKQTQIANIENKLISVVTKMEADGIKLNAEQWLVVEAKAVEIRDRLNEVFKIRIADFAVTLNAPNGLILADMLKIPVTTKGRRKALEEITDINILRNWIIEKFNPKSNQQMKTILNLMGIAVEDTNAKTIKDYTDHEIIRLLLNIREVNKQIDNYGRNVIELIHPVTGKIHTDYLTLGTRTGRFSSQKPNMQNVPRVGGYRECFKPDAGYLFAAVDYSQQEYRLAGAISGDRRIIEAYQKGSDMHTATAQILYGKQEVSKEERTRGKSVNFAILYGSTEYGLQYNLQVSLQEAKRIIDNFWNGYSSLSKFMKAAGELILQRGYSATLLKRRRYNLQKPTFFTGWEFDKWQSRILREGKNHIIQGSGADMIKIAMIECFERNPFGDKFRLCLQVHDELIAQVHESVKEEGLQFMKDIMVEVGSRFLGEIPCKVDGDLHNEWSK